VSDVIEHDRLLAKRLLRSEERAFDDFFAWYFPRLYRFALARLRYNHDMAEEVVQATLCKAITVLKSYRGEAPLFTWLCTLCRREMSAQLRKGSREQVLSEPLDDSPEIRAALESLAASLEGDPEDELRRKQIAHLVQVTLDFLPAGYGDALEWKYALGFSVREIAERLKLSPKAAESLLTRAREAFREEFAALTEGRVRRRFLETDI